MTKDEIKKGLEVCTQHIYCKDCPYRNQHSCMSRTQQDALALITEQEKEIERLKAKIKQAKFNILGKLRSNISNSKQLIQSHIADGSFTIEEIYMEIDELFTELNKEDKQ